MTGSQVTAASRATEPKEATIPTLIGMPPDSLKPHGSPVAPAYDSSSSRQAFSAASATSS